MAASDRERSILTILREKKIGDCALFGVWVCDKHLSSSWYLRIELSLVHGGHIGWCDNICPLPTSVKQQNVSQYFKQKTHKTEETTPLVKPNYIF